MQKSVLIYGQLCETSYKKKYWQPRKTYVMVAPPRLGMAVTQTLEAWFTKEPEAVQAMVNPQISGPATRVIVKKEGRISVTITPYTAESYPGIELGEWYQPLEQCWLRPEFSLADYQALLGAVEAEGGQTQGWD
jgi:hypothetical protein